jgi:small subunit ribosomal protein S2
MQKLTFETLLDAGVHFGHLKRKWNPAMAPYIFMEKNGIHIIDLHKTIVKLDEAANAMKQIAKSGRKILFVATKKQAKDIVAERVKQINMPYVTERWPGGMLTNFPTIRKAVKKMNTIDRMATDGTWETLSKRERLQIQRQRAKLEKNLGSIADLSRLPAAMFVIDVAKEYIAVREANRLNIPVFGMVDTNSNPNDIDFPIPANDDAAKSISLIIDYVASAIEEGISERKLEKDKEVPSKDKKSGEEVITRKGKISLIPMDEDEEEDEDDEDVEVADEAEETEEVEIIKAPAAKLIVKGDEVVEAGKKSKAKKPAPKKPGRATE